MNKYPTVAVQTKEAEKFFKKNRSVSKKLITGPLVLARPQAVIRRSSFVTYLHASTLKPRESEKFWGVERKDEFVRSVNDVVTAVHKQVNARLKIKLHPAAKKVLNDDEWSEMLNLTDRIELARFSLEKELGLSDILISYSSTAVEEAIICRKPVILYDKWKRYKHMESLDPKRTEIKPFPLYYIDDYDVLCDSLPKISDPKNLSMIDQWDQFVYVDEKRHNFTDFLNRVFS